jgi:hypothetical protein
MSQNHVEWLLGRLATDRDFRQRFYRDTETVCSQESLDLTSPELTALIKLDPVHIEKLAVRLDPRIVRANLRSDRSAGRRALPTVAEGSAVGTGPKQIAAIRPRERG